ncbi:MAG: hypothetical protein KAV82_13675 [Phycisphaerae bacterium]|nr:hypothetical protein [Phycisphaerae bacterium]
MRYIVKGSPMSCGVRATAQEIGACGRFAVGVFGGAGTVGDGDHEMVCNHEGHIPFPPHTVIVLAEYPAEG